MAKSDMVKKMADKQNVSALMDGESVDTESILSIETDPQQNQAWRNYHLIGDVMRGEAPEKVEWNIADGVAAALEHEAPHTRFTQESTIESQPEPTKAKRTLPSWFTQLGQVAIAASVSLAVIVGVQQYGGDQVLAPQVAQTAAIPFGPTQGSVEPVSLTSQSFAKEQPGNTVQSEEDLVQQRRKINALLQDYELQLRINQEVAHTAE